VFDGKKTSSFVSTDHEWEMSFCWWRAGVFTAEIDEVRSRLISPVRFINPVTHLESAFRWIIMVDEAFEPKLLEIVVVNIRESVGIN
jgi:hypothetical protein